ncbi:unnamed protein product [Lactuca virosa]|uniref:Uncharacterized protein n=1 Tax=Lactuca virosa TaxID=75947 RepID=A0AAU9PAW0_9ASTR|nr:unnamed protein product [Lactuca virosa]
MLKNSCCKQSSRPRWIIDSTFLKNSCCQRVAAAGGRRWPVEELGFPTRKFGQIYYRSVCPEVFGEECPKKFLILIEGGGGMKVFRFFGELEGGGGASCSRWRSGVVWSELDGG